MPICFRAFCVFRGKIILYFVVGRLDGAISTSLTVYPVIVRDRCMARRAITAFPRGAWEREKFSFTH
jgi:hypothetical protein